MIEALIALAPPVALCLMFVIILRAIIGSDRRERAAQKKIAEEIARRQEAKRADGPEV